MIRFFVILAKELRSYFASPIAYIVLAFVMVLGGISFRFAMSILENEPQDASLVTLTFGSHWFWMSYFPIFPLLTMRLFSEEKKMGTLETLLTAPVRTSSVVLAKYVASFLFYAVLWLPSILNFLIFQTITDGAAALPPGQLWGSYVIILLTGAFHLSIGCLASALTSNQIVAAVMAFVTCLVHFLLGWFVIERGNNVPPELVDTVRYFSSVDHFKRFSAGLIDTRPFVYYLTAGGFFLFLTYQVIEFRRWRS